MSLREVNATEADAQGLELTPNALLVLRKRYLRRGPSGEPIETPLECFQRVARAIASVDSAYGAGKKQLARTEEEFFRLLARIEFFPNSPTWTGAGTPLGQLAACFVLPVDDDLGSIYDLIKYCALIHQTGGGTGFALSRLRPKNAYIRTSGGRSSGPVSFLRAISQAIDVVSQGGTRRGANMCVLRIDHPDILEFIHCKEKDGEISNFNISVGITDAFMRSVENDQDFELRSPHDGSVWHTLKAREIFREIVRGAYRNGEPGVLFLDRMNRWNPAPHLYELEATNPCGEQSLGPFENCCLGSINLAKHVTLEHTIDWARLERTVHSSVHFLDNVIDANKYVPAIPQLREWALRTRRIGLGIMGFGDLLYEIGVSYATPEGEAVAEQVVEFIAYHSKLASVELAKKRGRFPEFEGSIYSRGELGFPLPEGTSKGRFGRPDLRWAKVQAAVKEYGIRNSCTNTVAPTGTIGTVAGVEGYGCEPVFALAYYRNMRDGDKLIQLPYVSPAFERVAKEQGFWSKDLAQVLAKTGSCQNLAEVPVEVQGVFVTARDITPEGHVRMQAAFQRFTDNSISKTINFPAEATEQDVEKAYFLAWQLGLKGLTVYRDGSRDTQVLNVGNAEAQLAEVTEAAPIQASNGHTSAPEPVQLSAPASNGHASEPRPSEVKPARLPAESVASTGLALGEGVTPPAEPVTLPVVQPRERPVVTTGTTEAVNTGCGKLYVTINEDERGLAEVFARLGRSGGCAAAQTEAIGRMVSLALRAGVDPAQVTRQLRGIRCPAPAWNNGQTILSCADAIAVAMSHHLGLEPMPVAPKAEHDPLAAKLQASAPGQHSAVSSQEELRGLNPQCPECGGYIKYVEGCVVCGTCGYTRCG